MSVNYQTLFEFYNSPFGEKLNRTEYDKKYRELGLSHSLHIKSILDIDDSYLLHIKVPSEKNKDIKYDVVIMFFTHDSEVKKSKTLINYNVKFFSNSPSFVYRYANLYYTNGLLIESLANKLNEQALTQTPTKSNSKMELSVDKSIYYASKYLVENSKIYLSKMLMFSKKTKNANSFFKSIDAFDNIMISSQVSSVVSSIKKELMKKPKGIKEFKQQRNKKKVTHRKSQNGKINTIPKKGKITPNAKIGHKPKK